MIVLLSPAKSLNFENKAPITENTLPRFLDETQRLAKTLKKYSSKKIADMMGLSSVLADLNYERFQNFSETYTSENSKQALWAFTGEVYRGLDAVSLSENEIDFAQNHLRLLSGMYGLLRPLDYMQPYRLEMGSKLKVTPKVDNLYKFWDLKITDLLNEDAKGETIINLASNEYFKSIKTKQLKSEVITPVFKDFKNGQYKTIMTFAKNARGVMARYIIQNQLTEVEQIKLFNGNGYSFDVKQSTDTNWVFVR